MKKEEEVDRRKGWKTISKSGKGWTLPSSTRAAEDKTRWKGVVANSSVVLQRPR